MELYAAVFGEMRYILLYVLRRSGELLRSEKEIRQKKYAHLALFDDGILGSMTHLGTFGTELREAAGWAQAWTRKEEMEFVNCLTEDMPCGGEVVACTENDRMYEAKFIVNELKKEKLLLKD